MKREYILKLAGFIAIVVVLAAVFYYGGNAPSLRGWSVKDTTTEPVQTKEVILVDGAYEASEKAPQNTPGVSPTLTPEATVKPTQKATAKVTANTTDESVEEAVGDTEYSEENGMEINEETGTDKYKTEPVPEGKPVPVEPDEVEVTNKEFKCTLSVRCDTILENLKWLDKSKRSIIPSDGVIFKEQEVVAYEGESVFNVLFREMKKNKIHMEFMSTPIYNSVYLEGIANIYEFDCGELSGWIYKVNGWAPNYGCSRYQLKENDKIEIVYTCNRGKDVGSYFDDGQSQKDE